jgi:hypothetical protein
MDLIGDLALGFKLDLIGSTAPNVRLQGISFGVFYFISYIQLERPTSFKAAPWVSPLCRNGVSLSLPGSM